jgi:hypothetical protein
MSFNTTLPSTLIESTVIPYYVTDQLESGIDMHISYWQIPFDKYYLVMSYNCIDIEIGRCMYFSFYLSDTHTSSMSSIKIIDENTEELALSALKIYSLFTNDGISKMSSLSANYLIYECFKEDISKIDVFNLIARTHFTLATQTEIDYINNNLAILGPVSAVNRCICKPKI